MPAQNQPGGDVADLQYLGADIHRLGEGTPTQDDLLAQAVKGKRSLKKFKPGSWIKKVFKGDKRSQSKVQANEKARAGLMQQYQSMAAINTPATSRLRVSKRPEFSRRASAPSLPPKDNNKLQFEDLQHKLHSSVPAIVGEHDWDDSDFLEDDDNISDFDDQWEVGSSDSEEDGDPEEESFISEESMEKEAEEVLRQYETSDPQATGEEELTNEVHAENPNIMDTEHALEADAEVEVLVAPSEKKKKRKPKKIVEAATEAESAETADTSPESSPEEGSNYSIEVEEMASPRKSKTKKKKKKGLEDSARDITETTVDLGLSSSDWSAAHDDPFGTLSEKKKKNSFSIIDEGQNPEDEEVEVVSKKARRKSKKSKDESLSDENNFEQIEEADEAEVTPTKKSKRKSKKNKEDSESWQQAEADSEEPTKKAKRKSRKSQVMAGALGEIVAASEDTEQPDSDGEESTKKSKRKSKKTKETVEARVTLSALLDDVVNTRNNLHDDLDGSADGVTLSQRLLEFLEKTLDCFAEVSDALELIVTFSDANQEGGAHEARNCISQDYAPLLHYLWKVHLQATVERYWQEETEDEALKDLLYRVALILKVLTAQFRYQFIERGEPASDLEQDPETKKLFVTLFELVRHDAFAIGSHQRKEEDNNEDMQTFQPSAMLQEAWGVALDSQIWHDVYQQSTEDPKEFRRECIRFVAREADEPIICVKAMKLLLGYCELDFSELQIPSTHPSDSQNEEGPTEAGVPKAAKLLLRNIAPLTREQMVDQILSRILPPDDPEARPSSITALQGRPGVGKTVLAAQIAEHKAVREHYRDGVVWIRLGRPEDLTYARYVLQLQAIAKQLGEPLQVQQQSAVHLPGESEAERRERERKSMAEAKGNMAALLKSKRVLLILDDISNEDDLGWFDFFLDGQERSSTTLLTTRSKNLTEQTNVLSVTKLGLEKEAAWLLHRECNSTNRALAGKSFEMTALSFFESESVRSMVNRCSLHPMAIATLGRFIGLHSQQNNLTGEESIAAAAQIVDEFQSSGGMASFLEVLNMSLSPTASGVPAQAIRLCMVAFVSVFCTERHLQDHVGDAPYPRVPVDIAELLFESVLTLDDEALKEEEVFYKHKKKAAELIHKVLCTLGILADPASTSNQTTYLTHPLYAAYVENLIDNHADIAQFATNDGKAWHRALVSNLMDGAAEWELPDSRQTYATAAGPFHMICGEMFVEAGDILANRKFTRRRIATLGLQAAVQRQVKDVNFLLEKLVPGPIEDRMQSKQYYVPVIRQAYQALVDTITKIDNGAGDNLEDVEVSQALLDIGLSFSEWRCYEDAVACWMASLLQSSMNVLERSEVLFNVAAAHEELREYNEALTFLNECLELQRVAYGDNHTSCARTLQKIGGLLLAKTDYPEALQAYTKALDIFCSSKEDVQVCIGDVQEMLGRVCHMQDQLVEAVDHYLSALHTKKQQHGKKSPLLAPIYYQTGICLLDMGKKDDAQAAFERAVALVETEDEELNLSNPDFLIPKGMLFGMQKKKKVSRRCFKRAAAVLEGDDSMQNSWKLSFVKNTLGLFENEQGEG